MNEEDAHHEEIEVNSTQETTDPGARAAGRSPARPLVRSLDNRMIGGVAGGLGEHFDVDPLLFRLGFIVLTISGGVGLLAYAVAWLLIPQAGAARSVAEEVVGKTPIAPSWVGIALLALGVLLLQPLWGGDPEAVWAVALIVAGVLLYRSDAHPPARPATSPAPPPAQGRTAHYAGEPAWKTWAERPRRPRSNLGRYTVAAVLVVLGGSAILENLGVVSLEMGQYPALALVVIGAGLTVGALWGRARGLIVLGLLVLPVALVGSAVEAPVARGFGERSFAPLASEDVRDAYRLGGGEMVVDLSRLQWPDEPVAIDASVGMGELNVIVPSGVYVDFDGHVAVGDIEFFDRHRGGVDVSLSSREGNPASRARLTIDATTALGAVQVIDSGTTYEEAR